jgi:branched-chain amino acid transport system ATP-binding protein
VTPGGSGGQTQPSSNLLTLQGVHTHIGAYHILHGVDLVVPRGELTMLLGRNGAGKTTTLRTIMGLWQASQGSIRFGGQDITRLPRRHSQAQHRLCAREHGHLCRPHGQGKPAAGCAPAAADRRGRLQWIFELFPACRSSGTTRPASSAAGKSRWWPWRAPSSSRASC